MQRDTLASRVVQAVQCRPEPLRSIYSFVLQFRPGTAEETIRARVYEAVQDGRVRRVAPGVYFARSGPAALLLIEGDARSVLESLDDDVVDAIITDPPYDLGTRQHTSYGTTRPHRGRGRTYRQWDLDAVLVREMFRVLRKHREWNTINPSARRENRLPRGGGALLLFTPNISRSTWPHIRDLIELVRGIGFEFYGTITWDQEIIGMGYDTGRNQKGEILFFTAGPRNGLLWDLGFSNLVRARRLQRKPGEHEAEKPVGLFGRLVEAVTRPGDVVLDPFVGRGRWVRRVLGMGRHVIVGDLDPKWVQKIAGDFSQTRLLAP